MATGACDVFDDGCCREGRDAQMWRVDVVARDPRFDVTLSRHPRDVLNMGGRGRGALGKEKTVGHPLRNQACLSENRSEKWLSGPWMG